MKKAGNEWLKDYFKLINYNFTHSSYIGTNQSISYTNKGNIEEVYGPKYQPEDNPLSHIEFSLKYDDLNLDFLKKVFENLSQNGLVNYIETSPSSKLVRKIGFLFEFLTGKEINLKEKTAGNYTEILDPNKYFIGNSIRNTKWRINNNLPGDSSYCPIVRKTNQLKELLNINIRNEIELLKKTYLKNTFKRALGYLFKKETKSSFEIEHEKPSEERTIKFISLLSTAGNQPEGEILIKKRLIELQNAIVDKRYASTGYRDFQNYVGESLPNSGSLIHYICPPPDILDSLMEGLTTMENKTNGKEPLIRTALIAFGFVFIHPFNDGNGRLHRFLIHDVLVNDGLVPKGIIIPVSAHMVNNMGDYDDILEAYSKPLMQRAKFRTLANGEIKLLNADDLIGYYKYPDLTEQCIYLIQIINNTLTGDIPDELLFIKRYDTARKSIQNIVDMPDKEIDKMMLFLHQNGGFFPKRKRKLFSKITDEEISKMENAYCTVFGFKLN